MVNMAIRMMMMMLMMMMMMMPNFDFHLLEITAVNANPVKFFLNKPAMG